MLLAAFRIRYPEFGVADDTYVSAFLAGAALRMDASVWGPSGDGVGPPTLFDEAQGILACHLMAVTPAGYAAGMANKWGRSAYGDEYDKLCRLVAGGPMAVGDPRPCGPWWPGFGIL